MMQINHQIDLWVDRGVPYAVVRKRLRERDERDCVAAFLLIRSIVGEAEIRDTMIAAADDSRSALDILNIVDPKFQAGLNSTSIPPPMINQLLELQALAVEACVRGCDACFPQASKN